VDLERFVFSLAFVRAVALTIDLLQGVAVLFRSTGVSARQQPHSVRHCLPAQLIVPPSARQTQSVGLTVTPTVTMLTLDDRKDRTGNR
jgi:hypothetical protein